jgi:antitoxin YefM
VRSLGTVCPATRADRTGFCTINGMKTISFTESRANYAATLDAVVNDREEIVVTRAGHDPVVIVSLADYESLKETAYLLRSPRNAARLLAAIENLESGGGTVRDLVE